MKRTLRWLWIAYAIMGAVLLTACGSSDDDKGLNWKVDDFTFTNHEGQPVELADLQGKVWVADFIFVNCTSVCPPMTSNMAMLQNELKKAGVTAELVSFSVDPEQDTPEVLKQYGIDYNVDFANWHFLTGYTPAEIRKFAERSFKTTVVPERNSDQVIHGTSFYIIDTDGTVYARYEGVYDPPLEQMVADIRKLTKRAGTKPASDASSAEGNDTDSDAGAVQAVDAELVYRQSCLACHGTDLEGRSGPGLQKVGATLTEAEIKGIISDGKGRMPRFQSRLDDAEIDALARWLASKS